jgi:hypothetical protein
MVIFATINAPSSIIAFFSTASAFVSESVGENLVPRFAKMRGGFAFCGMSSRGRTQLLLGRAAKISWHPSSS